MQEIKERELFRNNADRNNADRQKIVRVSLELLQATITSGWTLKNDVECIEGLPCGAKLLRSWTDEGILYMVYSHPSFPAVDEGATIPDQPIQYSKR